MQFSCPVTGKLLRSKWDFGRSKILVARREGVRMAINPNSAFVRVIFDLPTPDAIKLDEAVKASGKTKKQWLADTIKAAVDAAQTSKRKK